MLTRDRPAPHPPPALRARDRPSWLAVIRPLLWVWLEPGPGRCAIYRSCLDWTSPDASAPPTLADGAGRPLRGGGGRRRGRRVAEPAQAPPGGRAPLADRDDGGERGAGAAGHA